MNKADSLYQLGLDYYQGNDLPQDTDIAIDYLIKASKLNHYEAKVLCGELLFKQAKNDRSIYYEDGYRLGTEMMIDIYRTGKIEITLPYLLNNDIFNSICSLEEMEDYYQEAYRLGYRETKFELAKLLYKKKSYHSAEQWFLESIKEDISKESHLYLYYIYCTEECFNTKKAMLHLKDAFKNGYIASEYKEFIEKNNLILMDKRYYDSEFSFDKIKSQIVSVASHCYYAEDKFKKWLTEDKVRIRIYFDLKIKPLNASYDYAHSDIEVDDFIYEPVELSDGYFNSEPEKAIQEDFDLSGSTKDSGFYQSMERNDYLELNLIDVFDHFDIKEQTPVLGTKLVDDEIDQSIRQEIRKDIKNKHRDRAKHLLIRVKKFNVYKTLIPSFDFMFTYHGIDFISKKYAFDSPEWSSIFLAVHERINYKAIKFDMEFPLCEDAYNELEDIKKEVPTFRRRAANVIVMKIATLGLFIWSLIIFLQNRIYNERLHVSTYNIEKHINSSLVWYIGGIFLLGASYYLSRVRIYAPSITNLKEMIVEDPEFVLPKNTNNRHFRKQYLQVIFLVLLAIIFFLSSGFLQIIR
ncbi:MAG: hypothetical protein KKG64_02010 [Firmicutes bacterium]|nr:hypothetical protein [Bacillota bacterium]